MRPLGGRAGRPDDVADAVEYSHLPLAEQLEDHGIRNFELDVFAGSSPGGKASRGCWRLSHRGAGFSMPLPGWKNWCASSAGPFAFGTGCRYSDETWQVSPNSCRRYSSHAPLR